MASKSILRRGLANCSIHGPRAAIRIPSRSLSRSTHLSQQQEWPSRAPNDQTTHFGFQEVPQASKQERVGAVFSSVATSYDTMNDLMSLYIHRLWKDHFVRSLNPGSTTRPQNILDVAGGTGDIAFRILEHATLINNDHRSTVTVTDINGDMLAEGQKRSLSTPYASSSTKPDADNSSTSRLRWIKANAESFPPDIIPSNSIDLYTVAFGIRNFTDKQRALREAFRVLKPGGLFACLEFGGRVSNPLLNAVYKRWSFGVIPLIGQLVAADRESYQYLVESIERFPSQEEFMGMIETAGFVVPGGGGEGGKGWEDLTGGIAAIHRGIKPLV